MLHGGVSRAIVSLFTLRAFALGVTLAAVLGGVLSLAGCSVQKTVSGWFGAAPTAPPTEGAAGAGEAYYAGAAGLKVYSEPTSSSKIVGKLSLHEKVARYKVERGYAYVKADTSGLTGWVNNAMLLWRLPAGTPARAEPTPKTPAEPVAEEPGEAPEITATPESQEPSPAPSDTPATSATPRPRKAGPSLFEPY